MPNYSDFTWEDFKVSVKPGGIRGIIHQLMGRKIGFNIPYSTGSDVILSLGIETISGNEREFAYNWTCLHEGADDVAQRIKSETASFLGNPQKKVAAVVMVSRLRYQGYYDIQISITYPIKNGNDSPSISIANFYTTDRDAFTLKLLFAIVGILAGLFGALIEWLLGN
jgi:hypothetical protein